MLEYSLQPLHPDHADIDAPGYYFDESGYEPGVPNKGIIENRVTGARREQQELLYEISSPDGIYFMHCNASSGRSQQLMMETSSPHIHMNFAVQSNSTYQDTGSGKTVAAFRNYEYNLAYLPVSTCMVEWKPEKKVELFTLNLSVDFFMQYLPEDHPFIQIMQQGKSSSEPSVMSIQNPPLTPKIRSLLLDILNCPLEKHYKRLFLKAKVIELLSIVLPHLEEYSAADLETDPTHGLKAEQLNKIQQARELLHSNLQNPCSLIDLAHQVGTNENYLKKHFKLVFGNTVYGYIHELRMQQAHSLLMNQEKTVHEVALLSGYKHVNHFVTAFKKYFGYSPSGKISQI